jgi:hypothetical protein
MARLSSSEILNLILALTNYRVVVAKFLELAAVAGLTELPAIRVKLLRGLPRWMWLLKLLHRNWTWLRVHELWLPEIRAKLVRH